jgi:sec-independent protein translocase protein TatA
MGSFSIAHMVVLLVVFMVLFGGGRVSGLMGDFGLGIKNFRKGLQDDDVQSNGLSRDQMSRVMDHNPGIDAKTEIRHAP